MGVQALALITFLVAFASKAAAEQTGYSVSPFAPRQPWPPSPPAAPRAIKHNAAPNHDELAHHTDLISNGYAQDAWVRLFSTVVWNQLLGLQQLRLYSMRRNGTQAVPAGKRRKFPPLHIVISGDSTLRLQRNVLCRVLDPSYPASFMNLLEHHGKHPAGNTCHDDVLNIRLTYIEQPCCNKVYKNTPRPGESTVFYFNCGLHLLHLGRARPYECVEPWVDYEHTLHRFIDMHKALGPDQLNVFMTTQWICTEAFTGRYRDVIREWAHDRDGRVVEQCAAKLLGDYNRRMRKQQQGKPKRLVMEDDRIVLAEAGSGSGTGTGGGVEGDGVAVVVVAEGAPPPQDYDAGAEDEQDGEVQEEDGQDGLGAGGDEDSALRLAPSPAGVQTPPEPSAVQKWEQSQPRTKAVYRWYCRDALFTGNSTAKLNARALRVISEHARENPTDKRIHVVNGYSITQEQCWATSMTDGRHFPALAPLQVQRLLDIMHQHFTHMPNLYASQTTAGASTGPLDSRSAPEDLHLTGV